MESELRAGKTSTRKTRFSRFFLKPQPSSQERASTFHAFRLGALPVCWARRSRQGKLLAIFLSFLRASKQWKLQQAAAAVMGAWMGGKIIEKSRRTSGSVGLVVVDALLLNTKSVAMTEGGGDGSDERSANYL